MTGLILLTITWLDTPAEWFFLILDILLVLFIVLNIIDINRFEVRKVQIKTKKIEAGRKVRFVYLADLHSRKYADKNASLLKAIRDQKPDYIICGGDMMTAKPGKNNQTAVSFMNSLSKDYVIFYALGNHEHRSRIYPETYGKMYDEYMDAIRSKNIIVLDNSSVTEDEFGIQITGLTIEKEYYKRFKRIKMPAEYISETIGNHKDGIYQIMIAHNPEYGDAYFDYGADLFLSGHLHGGIIRLPGIGGVAAPSFHLFPKYSGGLYKSKKDPDKYGYVSCGLGTHTVPMRLFNPGEVTVIDIEGENA